MPITECIRKKWCFQSPTASLQSAAFKFSQEQNSDRYNTAYIKLATSSWSWLHLDWHTVYHPSVHHESRGTGYLTRGLGMILGSGIPLAIIRGFVAIYGMCIATFQLEGSDSQKSTEEIDHHLFWTVLVWPHKTNIYLRGALPPSCSSSNQTIISWSQIKPQAYSRILWCNIYHDWHTVEYCGIIIMYHDWLSIVWIFCLGNIVYRNLLATAQNSDAPYIP